MAKRLKLQIISTLIQFLMVQFMGMQSPVGMVFLQLVFEQLDMAEMK